MNDDMEEVEAVAGSPDPLEELKDSFRELLGMLSIRELSSNRALAQVAERLDRMLIAAGASV